MDDLKRHIREIPDFPKPGILFYDITTLLKNPQALRLALDRFAGLFAGHEIDKVVGIESRGFLFGLQLAYQLGVGFVPVRKPGKLPAQTVSQSYELEYGSDRLEMHRDAVAEGERVLIVDDLVATGGTARATAELVRACGADVAGLGFVVELTFLEGRKRLAGYDVQSLIRY
ncbi:MAG: adenine phosphoribosyltransferase [Acidobacteria bacterium]|nr:MAG: adenine phosphoribosyltransferase [Acidobacteriota bacterium]